MDVSIHTNKKMIYILQTHNTHTHTQKKHPFDWKSGRTDKSKTYRTRKESGHTIEIILFCMQIENFWDDFGACPRNTKRFGEFPKVISGSFTNSIDTIPQPLQTKITQVVIEKFQTLTRKDEIKLLNHSHKLTKS
jgi:hypothetical protein